MGLPSILWWVSIFLQGSCRFLEAWGEGLRSPASGSLTALRAVGAQCHFPGDSLGGGISYKNVNNGLYVIVCTCSSQTPKHYNSDLVMVNYQVPDTAFGSVYS